MNSAKLYGSLIRAGAYWFVHVPDIDLFEPLQSVKDYMDQIDTIVKNQVAEGKLVITRSALSKSAIFYVKAATNRVMQERGLFPSEFKSQLIEVVVPVVNK